MSTESSGAILVTGANGQLGSELRRLSVGHARKFLFTDVDELDITHWPAVAGFFRENAPAVVINCAAYNAVDQAETEEKTAFRVNAEAPGNLARAASTAGVKLIHVSTDYVFDGAKSTPYLETDTPNPLSRYAASKLAGEEAVAQSGAHAVVIRTSWLYSVFGANFVKTILRLGAEREELKVIIDQVGTPTYAFDLAQAVLTVLEAGWQHEGVALYQYSNDGVASWYDFATAIVELAGLGCRVLPIETADFVQAAKRPSFSVMNKARIKADFALSIPHWRESLEQCVKEFTTSALI